MNVRIIRSPKRKKTVHAKIVEGTLMVHLPLGMHPKIEEELIGQMKQKIENRQLKTAINKEERLKRRFDHLNNKYFKGNLKTASIEFVTNQNRRNGSCTPDNGTIRISHKLLDVPDWVLDYVIMHEMTHLIHPDHSKAFWEKVSEYKYSERARGFLIAKGMDDGVSNNEGDL